MTNSEYAEKNEQFRNACIKAGIPPTKRQASKYRLRSGRAYQFRNGNAPIPDECFNPTPLPIRPRSIDITKDLADTISQE